MRVPAPDDDPTHRPSGPVPTLRKRAEFLKLAKGLRRNAPAFAVQVAPAAQSVGRFGFTVTKKTGNAPERNRIRRRLRAVAAQLPNAPDLPVDVVIVARRACLDLPFPVLAAGIADQISHARLRLAQPRQPSSARPA